MRTRIIALIIAVILAIVGGVLLVQYVNNADRRAAAGAELTDVLVVSENVPAGTPVDQLMLFVSVQSIPTTFLAEGAISSLDELTKLTGYVTTAALVPGEQVISERLASPDSFVLGGGSVQVPEGLQEISISLDTSRVVGGRIAAGNLIGIFVSVEASGDMPRQTKVLLERVLVTAVTGGTGAADASGSLPSTVMVTVALSQPDVQAVIYAREFAQLWLSKQNENTTAENGVPFTLTELAG